MVVLARVDQRLIHGLIVNQWAPHLQVKRFMVVDDVLCNNEEIKASMRMAKPAGKGVSEIPKVDLGIIFNENGRTPVTKFIALNEKEKADLEIIRSKGVPIVIQYVPTDAEEAY